MTKIKKKDLILVVSIAAFALLSLVVIHLFYNDSGDVVVIQVDGLEYCRQSLDEEGVIEIRVDDQVVNSVIIEDGRAYMSYADCPDKLCIKQGRISDTSKSIVCLPNRVVVSIESDKKGGYDAVTN